MNKQYRRKIVYSVCAVILVLILAYVFIPTGLRTDSDVTYIQRITGMAIAPIEKNTEEVTESTEVLLDIVDLGETTEFSLGDLDFSVDKIQREQVVRNDRGGFKANNCSFLGCLIII